MKIIEQSHEILKIDSDILEQVEIAARNCYKSEDKICPGSAEKMVKMLIKKEHTAILEFGDITVRFTTNRGNTHEMVRHRVGMSYAQESTRYVRYDGNMEFIKPVWCSDQVLGVHTIEWINLIGARLEGQINPELPPAENIWFWNQAIAERDYFKQKTAYEVA